MTTKISTLSLRASYAAMAFLSAPKAFAQDIFGEVPDIGGVEGGSEAQVRQGILDVLEVVLNFMALIAVIFIVIAGIRLVVSQGEEQEKDKAKKTILYVIIGLVVILIAQAIVSFIADVLIS
jgi:type IV secretory pathway VirB2 component (pilin)